MKIEWDKVVTNAVSALVVATFMGAAAIVWKGATTVDTKVQQTRADMEHLINALSDQLSSYQVQLTAISNQLASIGQHQTNRVRLTERPAVDVEQRAYRNDIYQQLQPKK